MKKRDHTWDTWIEADQVQLYEEKGKRIQGEMKTIAATKEDVLIAGWVAWASKLQSLGISDIRTIRRERGDKRKGESN